MLKHKLKILFVDYDIHNLLEDNLKPVGGSCLRQFHYGMGLHELGYEVAFLNFQGTDPIHFKKHGFILVPSYDPHKGVRGLRWIYYRLPKIFQSIKNYRPDFIVQTASSRITAIIALICNALTIPFIHLIASDIDVDHRLSQKLKYLDSYAYRFGLKHCSAIICQNHYQLDHLKTKFPLKKKLLLPNPIYISDTNGKCLREERQKKIVWIGNFSSLKNIQRLLNIVQKHRDIHFEIVGKLIDKNSLSIKSSLQKLNDCSNVDFTGYQTRPEITKLLGNAKALLNTSDAEGFPNTFLEALNAGTPIISLGIDPDGILSSHKMGFVTTEAEIGNIFAEVINGFNHKEFQQKAISYLKRNHDHVMIARKFSDFIQHGFLCEFK